MIALSWSRISDWRQCPGKFRLKYVEKVANMQGESDNVHLIRGRNVHKTLENYVIDKNNGILSDFCSLTEVERTKPLIDKIARQYIIHPEKQIAIDSNFEPVDWFSKDAWFRVIFDLIGWEKNIPGANGDKLFFGDYKTGKFAEYRGSMDEPGQLHYAALVGMSVWSQFKESTAVYIYVDHKRTIPLTINMEQRNILEEKLVNEHDEINEDIDAGNFPFKKNEYCKWCDATKEQCKHGGKRKK